MQLEPSDSVSVSSTDAGVRAAHAAKSANASIERRTSVMHQNDFVPQKFVCGVSPLFFVFQNVILLLWY